MNPPRGGRLEDLLLAAARRLPDRTALVDASGGLSWRELAEHVEEVRGGLARARLAPGGVVAISLGNGAPFVASFLAVASLGGVALPLHPALTPSEIADAIGRARARWWIPREEERVPLPAEAVRLPYADLRGEASPIRSGVGDPSRTALLLSTSGSTGRPKLIPRTHENLVAEARHFAATVGVNEQDAILGAVPLQHAHGLGNCLLACLGTGAKMVLLDRFHRAQTVGAIRTERVTIFPGVPLQFAALAETPGLASVDLASLRLAFSAGAPLAESVFEGFLDRFGRRVRQLFGCSEAGSVSINLDPDARATAGCVGLAMEGVEVETRSPIGRRCSPGETGEIAIRSRALTPGYDADEERNALHFRDGWFFPGDLGRLDEAGRLWLAGRTTLFVNTAGLKVDPGEVEAALASHPAVAEVAVVGVPSVLGDELVKAVVVPRAEASAGSLLAHCAARLAPFKIPRIVEFRETLPRSPLGTLLRKDLIHPRDGIASPGGCP